MIKVAFSSSFKRAYKKRIAGNEPLKKRFLARLAAFQKDPFDKQLRTHKLSGNLSDLWSFSVEYDLRVIFYFTADENAVFIDIGTHDEVY
jgi:toxin HigB-1